MTKYQVIKLIKIKHPYKDKYIIRKENVYPYKINSVGHAKACARVVNSSIMYTDLHNKVVNVIVQDDSYNVVFVARTHIDGIYGNELDDLEM